MAEAPDDRMEGEDRVKAECVARLEALRAEPEPAPAPKTAAKTKTDAKPAKKSLFGKKTPAG